jgi:hypothetical protein
MPLRQLGGGSLDLADLSRLLDRGDEQPDRLVVGTTFQREQLFHGPRVERVGSDPIDGVGRHTDHLPGSDGANGPVDDHGLTATT